MPKRTGSVDFWPLYCRIRQLEVAWRFRHANVAKRSGSTYHRINRINELIQCVLHAYDNVLVATYEGAHAEKVAYENGVARPAARRRIDGNPLAAATPYLMPQVPPSENSHAVNESELLYETVNSIDRVTLYKLDRANTRKVARQNQWRERRNKRFGALILRMIGSSKSHNSSTEAWKLQKKFNSDISGHSKSRRGNKRRN
jgi:hypothetical protein